MQAVHSIHGKTLKQALFDHDAPTTGTLFGGLKDKHHSAFEIRLLLQCPSSAQQHGGMTIVAAGVHFARCLRGVIQLRFFTYIQSIDIGP